MRAGAHHDTGNSQHPSPESGKLESVATRTSSISPELSPEPDHSTERFDEPFNRTLQRNKVS